MSSNICDHDKCCDYYTCAHPKCCGYNGAHPLTMIGKR